MPPHELTYSVLLRSTLLPACLACAICQSPPLPATFSPSPLRHAVPGRSLVSQLAAPSHTPEIMADIFPIAVLIGQSLACPSPSPLLPQARRGLGSCILDEHTFGLGGQRP